MSPKFIEQVLLIANGKLGIKEATGNNDGPFIEGIQRWMDGGAGWMKNQPWCATFVSWCMNQAGLQLGESFHLPKLASSSDLYSWYLSNALLLPAPLAVAPCIGMLKGDGGTPGKTHHHTFFVESLDGDFVRGIDGNWQNAVSKTHHAVKDCDFGSIV